MTSDFRYAFRSLLKTPGFTVTALLTLALGIGVNTSMFTVTNTLLLQEMPFARPQELVNVYRTSPQSQSWPHSVANFIDTKAQSQSFTQLAVINFANCNYAAPGQPAERLRGMDVTGDFFPMLGISALRGRTFTNEETMAGSPRVVVISQECWASRFAGDPDIIGRQVRIDGELAAIIGVMPASFAPPIMWGPVQVWRPMIFTPEQLQNRGSNYLRMVGRLAPGVTLEQAQVELSGIATRLAQEYPLTNAGNSLRLAPYRIQPDSASTQLTWFVMGLAGCVLLIACANLANLQFARTAGRLREHAIRIALGASRWRIMRQLLAESLLLALIGGAAGLLVTLWCNDLIGRQIVLGPTTGLDLPLEPRIFAFSLLASVFCGLSFGLLPAWVAARADVNDALKQQARGSTADRSQHVLRRVLIITEVALALVLLAGAAVFIRGLDRYTGRNPGWQTEGLMSGQVSLPATKYPDDDSRRAFFTKLDDVLHANPLIQHAAIASSLPTQGYDSSTTFIAEGKPAPQTGREPLTNIAFVNPDYFMTLGLPLKQGREFNAEDRAGKPNVVVINETMARTFWPNENPIGRRIGDSDPNDHAWLEIVGVVGDVQAPGALNPPDTRFQIYRPIAQDTFSSAVIAVHGSVAPEALGIELRRAVAALDPDQPVHNLTTISADIELGLANYKLRGAILGGFALLGLALAAIGIYGVLAGFVAQRTSEIGIRMALGAQMQDVIKMVLGHGLLLAGIGTGIGLIGAVMLAQLLTRILPELGSPDMTTIAAVAVALLAVAAFACWLPARRASKVDPLIALRAE